MANYTNSPLVEYTHISPFRNSPRNQPITKVTWHHTAGVCSLEQFDAIVHTPGRNMSSNYMVDKDARVGLFCPESDRCWCSSSSWNDNRACVLEISNSKAGGDWPVSDKVFNKCIELTVDICKRNGIKKLTYTGDKYGSLTFHRFFAATSCVPIETTEVLTTNGWKQLSKVHIGDRIATVNPDTLEIKFDIVENMVPMKTDTVYTIYGMSVTEDHRVLCKKEQMTSIGYEFIPFHELENTGYLIPSAGHSSNPGLDMTSSEMIFLLEVQKNGVIDYENRTVSFSYITESNAGYFDTLINNIKYHYTRKQEDLGPVRFIVDDPRGWELISDYLDSKKAFTSAWMEMSPTQFSYFIYKVTSHENGTWRRKYQSDHKENIDMVQSLCALNERGSRYSKKENTLFICEPYRRVEPTHATQVESNVEVSCVTVKSGAFLIRQNGYTTITGNCPGEYIFSRAQKICDLVNAQLEEKPTPTPVVVDVKAGDLVKIADGAVYYGTTTKVPSWVINQNWYVSSVNGTRAVIGYNESKTSNINSAIDTKYLTVIQNASKPIENTFKPYTKTISAGTKLYLITNNVARSNGSIVKSGVYTIIAETVIAGTKYGELKSGAGWVNIGKDTSSKVDTTIHVGDYVKVVNAKTYDGKSFKVYASKYKVLQVNGDRIVISSDGKNVTAAINAKNIQKV